MSTKRSKITHGNARFTVYAAGIVHCEYRTQGKFPQTPSILTAAQLPPLQPCTVAQKGKTLTIQTDKLTLKYRDDGKPFHRDNIVVSHPKGIHGKGIWHPGDTAQSLCELVRSLDIWPHHEHFEREEHDGILNTLGRFCVEDTAETYRSKDNAWIEKTPVEHRGIDWWFFGYGKDYPAALRDFISVFGRIPLVPRWTFGYWYSRWYEYTADDILKIAKKYRKAKLPMDVMVIDTEWRTDNWRGYDWHPTRFKEPKKLVKQLHDMGLKVPLNDHPGYWKSDPLPAYDSCIPALKKKLSYPRYKGEWACNWADPECVQAWKEKVLSKPFKDGVDFWWIDGWIDYPFDNVKGQLWANRQYYEVVEECTGKRGIVLSRWGGWGSHRFPVQFSGDTCSDWPTLKHQIAFTADSCGAGAVYWSHDIGGFHNQTIDDDLYIRWIQFGAYSPVFRTHSAFGTREPFEYSKTAQKVFKKVVDHRYALIPFLYSLAREAYDTGLPICRPMYLHYPEIYAAYSNRHQYTLGKDILVAPAFMAGENVTRTVWLPPGQWIRPDIDKVYHGDGEIKIDIPLDEIPLFYRKGAIIPHQLPGEYSAQNAASTVYVDIYPPDDATAEFELYEDDGETKEFAKKKYARTLFSCTTEDKDITVKITRTRGTFDGQAKERDIVLSIWLPSSARIEKVQCGNAVVSKSEWKLTKKYAAGTCSGASQFLTVSVCDKGNGATVRIKTK